MDKKDMNERWSKHLLHGRREFSQDELSTIDWEMKKEFGLGVDDIMDAGSYPRFDSAGHVMPIDHQPTSIKCMAGLE
jgi:hypothetical protein